MSLMRLGSTSLGAVVLCLLLVLFAGQIPAQAASAQAVPEQSIKGVLMGIVNFGDAYGYAIQDAQKNTVVVAMGNGDLEEFQGINIGSVISLNYKTTSYPPEPRDVWQHTTILHFYVEKSGKLIKKGPPMPWDEDNAPPAP